MAEPGQNERLKASRRKASGKVVFPEIPATSPVSGMFEPVVLSDVAELYSFTIIHARSAEPLVLIYADFPEGARVVGRLVCRDGETPCIGMRVRAIVEESEPGGWRYHFQPVREH